MASLVSFEPFRQNQLSHSETVRDQDGNIFANSETGDAHGDSYPLYSPRDLLLLTQS